MIQDPETGLAEVSASRMGAFSDKSIRAGFIRKVYGIISVQLLVTTIMVLLTVANEGAKRWFQDNYMLGFACSLICVPVLCCLVCGGLHRVYPINMILLGIVTAGQAIGVTTIAAMANSEAVVYALILTTIVVLALTLFACQTKIDFTRCYAFMFVVLILFLAVGIIMIFFKPNKTISLVMSSIGCLIFSMYIIIDTQLIMGGSRSRQFSPEDYVLASINLYLDIINLFLYILDIMNNSS